MRRREFLQGLGAVALTAALPARALGIGRGAAADGALVIVELAGGNDGLNTVIPFADDLYHRARPTLAVAADRVVRLDDATGLHPELAPLRPAWDDGELAIIRGVGYPDPDRSHFRSMDIWQTAVCDRVDTRDGWIGRTLAASRPRSLRDLIVLGREPTPLAFRGAPSPVLTVGSLDDLAHRHGESQREHLRRGADAARDGSDLEFLRRSTLETTDVGARIERARSAVEASKANYPPSPFAAHLRLGAALLTSGFERSILWVRLGGFDTHARQDESHPTLLRVFGRALAAFRRDLARTETGRRTTIAVFSEFGRRVAENASRGTDHGAAGPMLLLGPAVRGGVHGPAPDLANLDDGDVRHGVDFRTVWSALSRRVLDVEAKVARITEKEPGLFRA